MRVFNATMVALALLIGHGDAIGQQPPDRAAEAKAVLDAADKAMKRGPADIKLVDQATLHLAKEYAFVPKQEANGMLKVMGNRPGDDVLGLILPVADDQNWFMLARYVSSGYIKDDEAKEWNVDELLKDLKEGTDAANADRRQRGIPEVEVIGWVERPAYDAATHRMVWSLSSRQKGAAANAAQGANYNTYLLGREGYISINLVTDLAAVEGQKPMARQMLAAVEFEKGKAYGDFNASTDRVAEYGLAALIGGVAAKKLGLFALAAAFFVKFAKVILLGVAAVGALAFKFFKRPKNPTT